MADDAAALLFFRWLSQITAAGRTFEAQAEDAGHALFRPWNTCSKARSKSLTVQSEACRHPSATWSRHASQATAGGGVLR